jgi:hypothetical protein
MITILTVFVFATCNNSQDKTSSTKDRLELVPESDKDLREKYETEQKLKTTGCIFLNPDTSLSKIKLRDSESTETIINDNDKIDDYDQYHYYSTMYRETLTMTQLSGDGKYQISIFKVEYSDKANYGYRKLNIDTFKTEKAIKLGLNKKQIIEKLGSCYVAKDSSKDFIELYYRLQTPNDSKTKILESNNIPLYYASYKLWKDRLEKFEFGFEYP